MGRAVSAFSRRHDNRAGGEMLRAHVAEPEGFERFTQLANGPVTARSAGRGFNPAEEAAANSLFVSRPEPLERTNCSGRETRG